MDVAVIGTGVIGSTIGQALSKAGHRVIVGSRHPDTEDAGHEVGASVVSVASAVSIGDIVLVAIPGAGVEAFAAENGANLSGKLVLDASNNMAGVVNAQRAYEVHAPGARYARVFNCLGVEVLQDPVFGGAPADMYFACSDADREIVARLVGDVGLHPVFVGSDADIVDGVFRLWIALAMGQRMGRQLAFRTLER